jgi:hypothetical protein
MPGMPLAKGRHMPGMIACFHRMRKCGSIDHASANEPSIHDNPIRDLPMNADSVLPYAFPIAFLGFWIFLTNMFRIISGFSWKISREYANSRVVDRVAFCSGQIRGIGYRSCLHVIRMDNGFLLKISRFFSGGSRYLADSEIRKAEKGRILFLFTKLTISIRGENSAAVEKLVFYGGAVDFMIKYLRIPVSGPVH